jgi:hypothetical protein
MTIEDSLEAPSARGEHSCLADFAAARARLRAGACNAPWTGPCSVVFFPRERISRPTAADRTKGPNAPLGKGSRWRGEVALLLPALAVVACGQYRAHGPTDAQLIAVVRQYGADLPHRVDPVTGRAVRIERTPREWIVTLIDPRRLDASRRHYVGGDRSAYHIDRATLRVVSVAIAK